MVVEFDHVLLRRIGVGQKFIDDHVAGRLRRDRIVAAGRTADGITRQPGQPAAFAVGGPREHERVTAAVRLDGPRILGPEAGIQQHGVAQAN